MDDASKETIELLKKAATEFARSESVIKDSNETLILKMFSANGFDFF